MEGEHLDTQQKAQQVNFDRSKYGAFAEIGAGQEVARWFFRAGGAAGTISKSMSAYDMAVSDAIYGPADRYVSRQRLNKMLEHEYELMYERLAKQRGASTKFFVFADTVAARSYTRKEDGNGWMGIRFQTEPLAPPNDIIIHVRLLDQDNLLQQEALGVVGVNLIYGAMYLHEHPEKLIRTLLDNLSTNRVEVDMIKFSGPVFATVDNRVMSLQLVEQGLTNAAMFNADGEVVNAADMLYKKPILIERGSFRPITKTTLHMLQSAMAQFVQEPQVQGEEVVVLFEMTLKNLTDSGTIDHKDFLERVDMLGAVGKTVIVSNYAEYHRLASYLFRYTKKLVGVVMGVPTLKELFRKYYADLEEVFLNPSVASSRMTSSFTPIRTRILRTTAFSPPTTFAWRRTCSTFTRISSRTSASSACVIIKRSTSAFSRETRSSRFALAIRDGNRWFRRK